MLIGTLLATSRSLPVLEVHEVVEGTWSGSLSRSQDDPVVCLVGDAVLPDRPLKVPSAEAHRFPDGRELVVVEEDDATAA